MDADIGSMTTEDREKLLLDLTFKETDDDATINKKIDLAISQARKGGYDDRKKEWDVADKLFNGDHESLVWGENHKKAEYKSDTVLNLVFPAVRNQAGLMTDQRPKPEALPAPADNEEEFASKRERAVKIEKALTAKWEEKKVQEKMPESCIQQSLYADTFYHPFWNYYEDDLDLELVPPHNLFIEPHALTIDEADWVIYRKVKTPAWLKKHFDLKDDFFDAKDMLYGDDKHSEPPDKKQLENGIAVDAVWTDEVLIIRAGKKVIKKTKNPLYEWQSVEEQQQKYMQEQLAAFAEQGIEPDEEQMAAIISQFVPITNFFDRPKKPFVQLKSVNDGKSLYSKSVMKQLAPIVQTINQRKQQIDDNCNQMANLTVYYDSTMMDEKDIAKMSNMPGAMNGIKGLAQSPNMLRFSQPVPLPQYVTEDMMHSQRIFDDEFGSHEVSRGAKAIGKQTATQVNRQTEADQTVVRLFVRQLEAATCEVYKWWVQLMKLFYTEEKMIRVIGSNESREYFSLSAADIDDGIDIRVTPGSTLPVNKEARRQEDIMLAQGQMLAPVDLYESLEKPNPEKLAQNLILWQQGQTPGMPAPVGQDPEQENQMMFNGQMVEAKPEDDHQGHMQVHMALLQEGGEDIPPEIAEMIEKHIGMHQEMMQQPQGAMMGGQGAGAA